MLYSVNAPLELGHPIKLDTWSSFMVSGIESFHCSVKSTAISSKSFLQTYSVHIL